MEEETPICSIFRRELLRVNHSRDLLLRTDRPPTS